MTPSYKLRMFAAGLALATLAGCGSNSSGNPAPPPPGPVVDQTVFDGDPGKFASLYTGTCVVQTPNRTYTSCSTRVRIQQTPYLLYVRTQFFVNQSNRANSQKIVGRSEDSYTITGKALLSKQSQVGEIGKNGFYFQRAGQPFKFARLYPNNYEYSGRFVDDSGRTVLVTGRVSRGSAAQSASGRTRSVTR